MFRIMNNYMREMKLIVNSDIESNMRKFLEKNKTVENYCITVNFNRYIVDIKLAKYSVDSAEEHFNDFIKTVKYPYSDMSVRYNEGKLVRYRYASCKENKEGFYCDIVYS